MQEGCGYKDTLRAHRYFAPLAKYFTVCITYQLSHVCMYVHTYMCVYMCVYIYIHTHIYIDMYIMMRTRAPTYNRLTLCNTFKSQKCRPLFAISSVLCNSHWLLLHRDLFCIVSCLVQSPSYLRCFVSLLCPALQLISFHYPVKYCNSLNCEMGSTRGIRTRSL